VQVSNRPWPNQRLVAAPDPGGLDQSAASIDGNDDCLACAFSRTATPTSDGFRMTTKLVALDCLV
jgi:hypothetical protein